MKKILSVLLAVLLILSNVPMAVWATDISDGDQYGDADLGGWDDPSSTDLIINGNFETGDTTGWSAYQSTTVDATAAYSGSYGAHLVGNGSWGGLLVQEFAVEPGQEYTITMWMKALSNGVNVLIRDGGTGGTSLGGRWFNTTAWTLVEFVVTPTTDILCINFCGSGTGSAEEAYVDDVTVTTPWEPEVPEDPSNLLQNGNFETGDATGWTVHQYTVVDATAAYSGSYGAHLVGTGGWGGLLSQRIYNLSMGDTYRLTFWIKVMTTYGINMRIEGETAALASNYFSGDAYGQWTQYEVEFDAENSIAVLEFCGSGTGSVEEVYVDDISVVAVDGCTHEYDHPCDPECNLCGEWREVGDHTFDNACDAECNWCGELRAVDDHVYTDATDAYCDVCGAYRSVNYLTLGVVAEAVIANAYDVAYFLFIPERSGTYAFCSEDVLDPMGYLYDATGVFLKYDDDGGAGSRDFRIEYHLEAGVAYLLEAKQYSTRTGNYDVWVEAVSLDDPEPDVPADGACILDMDFEDDEAYFDGNAWIENDGDNYLLFDATAQDWASIYYYCNAMKLNTDYRVTFKAKADIDIDLWFKIIKGDWSSNVVSESVTLGTTWQEYTFVINSGDFGSAAVLLFQSVTSRDRAAVYSLDDITITEVGSEPSGPIVHNSIINGGFETGDLTGWRGNGSATVVMGDAHSGSYALRVQDPSMWSEAAVQQVAVEPYQTYRLTWYAKRVSGSGVFNIFTYDTSDYSNIRISDGKNWMNDASDSWIRYSVILEVEDSTEIAVKVSSEQKNAGIILIDDISLTLVDEAEPSFDGYITNGDFEIGDTTGWIVYQSTVVDTTAAYSGSYGAHLMGNGGWGGMLIQEFAVEPGQEYIISMYIKAISKGINVLIKDGGIGGTSLGSRWFTSTEWTLVEFVVTPTTDILCINFCGSGTGVAEEVYVDDISVVAVDGCAHIYDSVCDSECNLCGAWREVAGHRYSTVEHQPPNCAESGYCVYTCVYCGATYEEYIPADGIHTYDDDLDADCNVCGEIREVCMIGDVNNDGRISILDLGVLQRYINGWDVTIQEMAADVNHDGRISILDLGILQRYINGWNIDLG